MFRAFAFTFLAFLISWAPASRAAETRECRWALAQVSPEEFEKKWTAAAREERVIEIGSENEAVKVEDDSACVTIGIGPCIGIAVVNTKTGSAHVGHFLSHTTGPEKLLDSVVEASGGPQNLKVYLVGHTPGTSAQDQNFQAMKEWTEEAQRKLRTKLKTLGFSKAQIVDKMTLENNNDFSLMVDTKTHKVYLTEQPDPNED